MDPFAFAIAVAAAVAQFFGQAPDTVPDPAPPAVVEQGTVTIPSGAHEGTTVIINPFDLEWEETQRIEGQDFSIGWVVSPVSGRLVCVTAAPCENDAHYSGPEDSSWNWITGEDN